MSCYTLPHPAYCIILLVSDTLAVKLHVFPGILFVQLHFAIWDVSKMRPKGQTLVMLGYVFIARVYYIYIWDIGTYTIIHYWYTIHFFGAPTTWPIARFICSPLKPAYAKRVHKPSCLWATIVFFSFADGMGTGFERFLGGTLIDQYWSCTLNILKWCLSAFQ